MGRGQVSPLLPLPWWLPRGPGYSPASARVGATSVPSSQQPSRAQSHSRMLLESFGNYLLSTYCVQRAVLAPDAQTTLLALFLLLYLPASLPPTLGFLLLNLPGFNQSSQLSVTQPALLGAEGSGQG